MNHFTLSHTHTQTRARTHTAKINIHNQKIQAGQNITFLVQMNIMQLLHEPCFIWLPKQRAYCKTKTNTTIKKTGYCNVGGESALVKPHTYTMYI